MSYEETRSLIDLIGWIGFGWIVTHHVLKRFDKD
jgi:hypothetical protein